MCAMSALPSEITQFDNQNHVRVKKEDFFSESENIFGDFKKSIDYLSGKKENVLNPAKIKQKISESMIGKKHEIQKGIFSFFEVH